MKRFFIFLAICLTQMAAAQHTGNTAFQKLGIADGLRSNSVTSLLADSRGYLWIGTYQGLNRYDGYQVKSRFPESGDPQLKEVFNQPITALEEDAEGRIWIECESGAYSLYDTKSAQFSVSADDLLQSIGIRCKGKYKVKVGDKGVLWVLTEGGIYRYDSHTKELKTWKLRVIRTIRIKRGRALLETSQMQVTDIAYAVGFTTVKSFTMNFKAEYGMTPTEFRNSKPPSSMS